MITIPLLIAMSVALIVGIGLFLWRRSRQPRIRSFWDVIRNPAAVPSPDEVEAAADERADELAGSPEQIAQLVDYVVFRAKSAREADQELRILRKLGFESYPRAIEILRDPSLQERLSQVTKLENSLPEAPIMRLCRIFDHDGPSPPEAPELLAPFLKSQSEQIRQRVALIIGANGSADSLPYLRRALADDNEYVRSCALIGIQRAIDGTRIEESTSDELFALVASLWPADDRSADVAPILLHLDRERAIPFLLDEKLLTVSFRPCWRILQAFNRFLVDVPRPRLLALIAEADQKELKYPLEWVLEQSLIQLGRQRHADDLPLLERFLDHQNEEIVRGAVGALYRYHSYYDRIRNPWDVVESAGWPALTEVERYICALDALVPEVSNGGFAQYYFNPSGDHWEDAERGLAAVGAVQRHQLLLATIQRFGDTKPSSNCQTRRQQLAALVRQQDNPFAAQDASWYGAKDENLDRLLLKYNLAHLQGREKQTAA